MQKRKAKVIAIAAILASAALILGLLLLREPANEPQYGGHSLSYWVDTYGAPLYDSDTGIASPTPELAAATNAISQIGTNALPFLLKWLRSESPSWTHPVYRMPGRYGRDKLIDLLERQTSRKGLYAISSFRLLGPTAEPAIPALTAMMHETNESIAARAIYALSCIGKPTFPLLTQALSDTNQLARHHIVLAIAGNMPRSVGTNACLRPILPMLTDGDRYVRIAATNGLTFLAPEAITNGTLPATPGSAEATNPAVK